MREQARASIRLRAGRTIGMRVGKQYRVDLAESELGEELER